MSAKKGWLTPEEIDEKMRCDRYDRGDRINDAQAKCILYSNAMRELGEEEPIWFITRRAFEVESIGTKLNIIRAIEARAKAGSYELDRRLVAKVAELRLRA